MNVTDNTTPPARYTVLLIDQAEEENAAVKQFRIKASASGLTVRRFFGAEEGVHELDDNFTLYSSIVMVGSPLFVAALLFRMAGTFGEHRRTIPWFILASDAIPDFLKIVEAADMANLGSRDSWGPAVYRLSIDEEADIELLFSNIRHAAEMQTANRVIYAHRELFDFVGPNKIFDSAEARKTLLDMLCSLYSPEAAIKTSYSGNDLRKVFEQMLYSAKEHGLLDALILDRSESSSFTKSNLYLQGSDVRLDNGQTVRFGRRGQGKDGIDGKDAVFDHVAAREVRGIIEFTNADSHVESDSGEGIDSESFYGHLMHLCHIIRLYCRYVMRNPVTEINLEKQQIYGTKKAKITDPDLIPTDVREITIGVKDSVPRSQGPTVKGTMIMPVNIKAKSRYPGQEGQLCIGKYLIGPEVENARPYTLAIVLDSVPNTGPDSDKFPYIATKIHTS